MGQGEREGGKLGVFISYSRDDLDFADQLDAALRLSGFFTTFDRHGISGGENWQRRLGALIRDADTVAFVLSPSSAKSDVCRWEVEEAVRLGKRLLPVLCRPLEDAPPPPALADLNYIFFYHEPKSPGSGFGTGLARLVDALNSDLDWLREHTRYLQRATEWDAGGRPANRLLSGPDIETAKAWAARQPKKAPAPTELQLEFIRDSQAEEGRRQSSEQERRLEELAGTIAAREAAAVEALAQAAQTEKEAAKAAEVAQAKRAVKNARFGLAVALALAIVAAAAAYYAFGQQREAEMKTTRAKEAAAEATAAKQEAIGQQIRAEEAAGQRFKAGGDQVRDDALLAVAISCGRRGPSAQRERSRHRPRSGPRGAAGPGERRPDRSWPALLAAGPSQSRRRAPVDTREDCLDRPHRRGDQRGGDAGRRAHCNRIGGRHSADLERQKRCGDRCAQRPLRPDLQRGGDAGMVNSVAVTPDGTRVITGSTDGTARIWDAKSAAEIAQFKGHNGSVNSVAVTPDGMRIVPDPLIQLRNLGRRAEPR